MDSLSDTDVVIFIDALSPREVSGFLEELKQGDMDSGTPRVTPRVMSSIYTGLNPAENGMMEVSKYGGEDTTRPRKSTFIDQAVREGMSVLSMGMPFCIPFQVNPEDTMEGNPQAGEIVSLLHGDALAGNSQVLPPQTELLAQVPPPDADMIREHPDRTYASFKDQTITHFNQFKENIRRVDPDVAFLGYRLIDSYCHFQHTETRKGQSYREHLIEDVASICRRIAKQIEGDLMFFSDHGQTKLTEVFRINRWLRDNGYLEYKVDYDFIDTFNDFQGEDHPVNERVENQVTHQQPGVKVDEENSQVICADPFDSTLTLLVDREEFDEEKFRQDLMDTGNYRSVKYKWELYDENAEFYDSVPDIIPDRAEGVFVSGNMHKEPIGMGYYRTGVHDMTACFGATCELNIPEGNGRKGMITPEQMNQVITDFIGLEITENPIEGELQKYTQQELDIIKQNVDKVVNP